MGILDRFRAKRVGVVSPAMRPAFAPPMLPTPQAPVVADRAVTPVVPNLPVGSTVAAVGESYYDDAFLRICGPRCADGYELEVVAELQPEPSNLYDPKAVAVLVHGHKVGHLSREEARASRAVIDQTIATHGTAVCAALIRGGWDRGRGDTGNFGIWLQFSNQPDAFPALQPGEFRLAPGGNVSVSHEEHYQDALVAAATKAGMVGASCSVIAELAVAETDPWRKANTGQVIEVRTAGQTVGFLTSAMTARYRPVIDRALGQDRNVTAEASIFRTMKKSGEILEVRLNAGDPELR